jgi:hypothetical protein
MKKKEMFFFEAKNKSVKKLTKTEKPKKSKELQKLMDKIFDIFTENMYSEVINTREQEFFEKFFFDLSDSQIAKKQKEAKKKNLDLFEFDDFHFIMGTFDDLKKLFIEEKEFLENHLREEGELENKRENIVSIMRENFQIDLNNIYGNDLADLFLDQEKMEKIMRIIKNQVFR